jgi:Zn-dependent metalloprotease
MSAVKELFKRVGSLLLARGSGLRPVSTELRRFRGLVVLSAILGLALPTSAAAQDGFGSAADVARSGDTGKVTFVGTDPGNPISAPAGFDGSSAPAAVARAYLHAHAAQLGVVGDQLDVTDVSPGPRGETAVGFRQLRGSVPVLGGELIVNLTGANDILSVTGEAAPLGALDTTPTIDSASAAERARHAVAEQNGGPDTDYLAGWPKRKIYDPHLFGGSGSPRLVWSVVVSSSQRPDIRRKVLVDAESGEIAAVFELVEEARNRRICDANNTRGAQNPCSAPVLIEGGAYTGGVVDVQQAYDFSGNTYDFYNARWARDSLDNAGLTLNNTVRYCTTNTIPNPTPPPPTIFRDACPYANAFWNGSQMLYGTGFTADDVVGHELTHGVTQFESNLVYANESGAINESLSDVFGEAVDLTNTQGTDTAATRWQIGEDIPGGPFRDMQDPTNFSDPDKMTSSNYSFAPNTPAGDNGGVHTNSGVNNKADYLLTDGDTFNTYTVSAIGLEKTVRVYYEAQTNLLTSGSDYGNLGNLLVQACNNLVGTAGIVAGDCTQVNNAVLATEMLTDPNVSDTTIRGGPAGLTNDATPTFTFSGNRPAQTVTFQCSIDQGTPSFGPCSGPGGSHTATSNLADGNYTFRVRAVDGAGTDPTPATRNFTVDATPPDTAIDSGPSGPTNDATPTFTFHGIPATDTDHFECSIDQGAPAFGACSGPGASHSPASNLADGNYTFRVRAVDAAGNADPTPSTRTFTVDTIPPETSIDSGPSGLTNDPTPTFTFSSNEPGTFQCSIDQGTPSFGPCSGPGASHTSSSLADGLYTFRVRAIDLATNVDPTPATRSFEVANCTVSGTAGPDKIHADPKRHDVICGFGGDDRLYGSGGPPGIVRNDIIFGGSGDDLIHDSAGDDRLLGEQGVDQIKAGPGNDQLDGGAGAPDSCDGGPGNDTVTACELVRGVP